MSAYRKHFLISFLILVLLIITISCYSIDEAYNNWQPRAATEPVENTTPQVVPNPDANSETGEDNQPSDQASEQQPIQQPDPQPDPEADPEPEQTELEKCVANKDVVLVNGDVVVDQVNDEATGEFISLNCKYETTLVSEASQPIIILYQWNFFLKGVTDEHESVFSWTFHGPMPPGDEKIFYQKLNNTGNALWYERLVSYVAIYDSPQCNKYVNSFDLIGQTRSVFFDCDQYIPKE